MGEFLWDVGEPMFSVSIIDRWIDSTVFAFSQFIYAFGRIRGSVWFLNFDLSEAEDFGDKLAYSDSSLFSLRLFVKSRRRLVLFVTVDIISTG